MENIYFTNWTDENFIGQWANENYLFPKKKRSPIILGSKQDNLGIRLKFAKDLTKRELHKMGQEEYTEDDVLFKELMQKCLEPLEIESAKEVKTPKKKRAPLGKKDLQPMDVDQDELKSFAGSGEEDEE
jgi:hypothetical protein